MDIGIFIEYDNRVVQIPVNPEKFNVSISGNNETNEIVALGEIVIPRKKKLATISWDSFFPHDSWYPAIRTSGDFKSAEFYMNFLDKIRNDCKPCHLTVTGIGFDDDVVIESFDYYHQAGDHEDTYYSITLKRYQPYTVSIISKVDIQAQLKKMTSNIVSSTGHKAPTQPPVTLGNASPKSSITINPTKFTIGAEAILNGTVYYDSYGAKPGASFTDHEVKVNLINKKGSHCYHVTNRAGGWLGWVTEDSLSFSRTPSKNLPPLKTSTVQTFSPILRNVRTKSSLK